MAIPQVRDLLKGLLMARSRFLYGLDRTPDDRLHWSPAVGAPTPLQVAGKLEGFLHFLAYLAQNRAMPEGMAPPPAPGSREESKARLDAAFARLQSVIAELSTADLEQPLPVPWGGTPALSLVLCMLPGVTGYFQGQLNYIQITYGDKDANIPPNWGQDDA
ncbi:MAG: DinB family protein [Armatimonadetes bacterium]|nr:DinB family protein [Armatimonadota bacterium]